MDKLDTVKYRGYKIEVYADEDPDNPRDWGNLGSMICLHRRYNLGDYEDLRESMFENWSEVLDYGLDGKELAVALPLYLYDHSGLSMSTSNSVVQDGGRRIWQHAGWDSGMVGWIFVTKEKLRKEFNTRRVTKDLLAHAADALRGEVRWYDDYLRGDVYGFSISDPDGNFVDSCFGYFGSEGNEHMLDEAEQAVDYDIRRHLKKHADQVKAWIRNKVPLMYRTPMPLSGISAA